MKNLKITRELLNCAKTDYNSFYLATLNFCNKISDTIGIIDCKFINSGKGCYHFVVLSNTNSVYVIHSGESGQDGLHKFETFEAFEFGHYFETLDDFFNDDKGWEFGEYFSYDTFSPYSEELIEDFYKRCKIYNEVKSMHPHEFQDISQYLGKHVVKVLECEDGGQILFLSDGTFYLELDRSDYQSEELKPLLERLCAFSLNENLGYQFYPTFKFNTQIKNEIRESAKLMLEHTINEIYSLLYSTYDDKEWEFGDETPCQRNKIDELTEQLTNEIAEQVYKNLELFKEL